MQVNNNINTSFKGGFRFSQMPISAKNDLAEFITTKKQIFNDFERVGDVFLVTRDMTNYKVAQFIKKHKLTFEFYPQVNTRCGLDTEKPEGLSKFLAIIKEPPIKTVSQLKKSLINQKRSDYIEQKSPAYIDKILKTLCIDNKHSINDYKGGKIVIDNEFNRKIYISPPSRFNIHYVMVKPDSISGDVKRYALDSQGNILTKFDTPDAIKLFNKRYNDLLVK